MNGVTTETLVTLLVGAFIAALVNFAIKRADKALIKLAELETEVSQIRTAVLGVNSHGGMAAHVEGLETRVRLLEVGSQ